MVPNKSGISKEFRHLGVMIESTNGNVKLIAEQFGDLNDNVRDIRKTVDTHTEMIGNLAVNLSIVKEDIEFIKGPLKKKIDVEEFSAL